MPIAHVEELAERLPAAVAQVAPDGCLTWVEAGFELKTGIAVEAGMNVQDVFTASATRDVLKAAIQGRQGFDARLLTCDGKALRVQLSPGREQRLWLIMDEVPADDHEAFALALQEIARAVGDSSGVESICAAAAVAMVRFPQVCHAEIFLLNDPGALRRVAASNEVGHGSPVLDPASLTHALVTGQPEIGFTVAKEGTPTPTPTPTPTTIFAAMPMTARRHGVGLLVLHKEPDASFSLRELDLWTATAGHLAVSVDNARLLDESRAALQMREEFISIASHELKTPLTPLKMSLFMMERRAAMGLPPEPALVTKAKRQVDRLAGLVNDLLDTSRLELGKLAVRREALDLRTLLAEVARDFGLTFGRTLRLEGGEAPVWVSGDRDRLEQVLVNLIENAHKYSPDDAPVDIALRATGDQVSLTVTDRGIGIPRAERERIFQRFYRAQNAQPKNFGGLGLGLYICQSIVSLHSGKLTVDSVEGAGSTFTLTLPELVPELVPDFTCCRGAELWRSLPEPQECGKSTPKVAGSWAVAGDTGMDEASRGSSSSR